VISIAAFLLIAYSRTNRSIWVALRYMFVGNVAMLFYLVGAVLVYQANYSFAYEGLSNAPVEAIALIVLGLLGKGGIFISGLWLPLTHSESETPVSALLSGVVVKTGVFPLVRFALMVEAIDPIVRLFGVGTALLGVGYAVFQKDTKRTLACSTISQVGWILAAPEVGGFFALAHGLAKSTLFLIAGNLPSRNFKELKEQPMNTGLWIALVMASLSISGFPLFVGFGAKVLTLKNVLPWQEIVMNLGAVGTAMVYAKFILLPHGKGKPVRASFWTPILLLLGALIAASGMYLDGYTLINITKNLAIIAVGWLAYGWIFQRVVLKLPRMLEQLEHLIGVMVVMSLALILLFKMVV